MIFKVAFDTGRVKSFNLQPPPCEPFIGFRVIIEEEGNTGIIVGLGQEEEASTCVHKYPDRLPLILPEHIKAIKELANFYQVPYTAILFQLIPSHFILYRDTFIYPGRDRGIDTLSRSVLEYIKKRRKYSYENAKKKFGKDLIDELVKKGILIKKEEWVTSEKPYRLIKIKGNIKEALGKVRSNKAKMLILHAAASGIVDEESLLERGFSKKTISSLLSKGIIEYTEGKEEKETISAPILDRTKSGGNSSKGGENFILWGNFDRIANFIKLKRDESDKSLLLITTSKEILKSIKTDKVITLSSADNAETLYKKWFSSYEGKKIISGTFLSSLVPIPDLDSIIVIDDTIPSVKLQKDPHIDIRNLAYILSKEFSCSFGIASPAPSLETFFLLKMKTIVREIKLLKDIDIKIIKRYPNQIISREIVDLLEEKTSMKLILANKRGYSYMYCELCQFLAQCPNCDKFLTYFKSKNMTVCTHCNFQDRENKCPHCGRLLRETGIGIEKIMELIERRYGIREDIYYETFPPWHTEYDYVIVVDADNILSIPDYKAEEQFYLFLWRCLTSAKKGLIVQTMFTENSVIESIKVKNPYLFLGKEMEKRRKENLPPFTRMINAIFTNLSSVNLLRSYASERDINLRIIKYRNGFKATISIDRKHRDVFKDILSFLRKDLKKFVKEVKIE